MNDLSTELLDFPFDERCIATEPAHPRDAARLLVFDRSNGSVTHAKVSDVGRWLSSEDLLVVNETAVIPARLCMASTEGLLLEPCQDGLWRMLLRRAKRHRDGELLPLRDPHGVFHGDAVQLVARDGDAWRVKLVPGPRGGSSEQIIQRSGWTPIPPYILKARAARTEQGSDDHDRVEYQTVYANSAMQQSIAAPTAGLHFTDELLASLAAKGVRRAHLTLHVGAGTFKPVASQLLSEHQMHEEWMSIPPTTLAHLAEHPRPRIVAVGTTSVRALESIPHDAPLSGWAGNTSILISPGHRFRNVDAVLTNFHLPRSTLLALVGAFMGLEKLKDLYAIAQKEGYRFYSFGDAMLII